MLQRYREMREAIGHLNYKFEECMRRINRLESDKEQKEREQRESERYAKIEHIVGPDKAKEMKKAGLI